jgi:large subunit ribosomal protein L30
MAEEKTVAKKAAPKKSAPKKAAAKTSAPKSGARVKLQRTGSPIRRDGSQRATLIGLGLTRANKIVDLEDTPSVRGMIRKVNHLIEVIES